VPDLTLGAELGPVELHVDSGLVRRYADAAHDHNPIHLDDDAARRLGLPGAIAHGMISGALLGRLVAGAVGPEWLTSGKLRLKFVAPVPVGTTVRATGRVTGIAPLTMELQVATAGGVAAVVGTATVAGLSGARR
jgi:acyl dehydratase